LTRTLSSKLVRDYYDAHADPYDRQVEAIERRLFGPKRQWATSRAAGTVVEIGVGGGLNLALHSKRVEHLVGVDISERMLDHARDRLRGLNLRSRIELRRSDAAHLDLPANSWTPSSPPTRCVLREAAACCASVVDGYSSRTARAA
jgi:ubiquinone/menaquinone biosynthesis C-methylase UbiE